MAHLPVSEVLDREGEFPTGETRAINPKWNRAAAQVGNTLGQAVNRVRQAPRRAQQVRQQIRTEVRGRLEAVLDCARPARLRQEAERTAGELQSRARENVQITRNRAGRLVRERPLEMIFAAFAAAFIFGIGLRIWRSNRA